MTLRVGLDFDNTLIDYDQVFGKIFVAEMARRGFAAPPSPGGKQAVKRAAIDIAGEEFWMAIQGQAYGRGIDDARLIDGVGAFFAAANRQAAELFIVSHKTEFGHFDDSRTNLREAARNWMDRHGFFTATGFALRPSQVFFEATVNAKIARICSLDLDYFVDDLEKVLSDPNFPKRTQRIWFHADVAGPATSLTRCSDWAGIRQTVFGND